MATHKYSNSKMDWNDDERDTSYYLHYSKQDNTYDNLRDICKDIILDLDDAKRRMTWNSKIEYINPVYEQYDYSNESSYKSSDTDNHQDIDDGSNDIIEKDVNTNDDVSTAESDESEKEKDINEKYYDSLVKNKFMYM